MAMRHVISMSALMLFASVSQADYRDPIDLPAESSPAATQSLLLDVTRAGSRLVAVGERGHILFSDDEGGQWQQAQVPSRAHLNAVSFVDEDNGWAVGEDAVILHSQDGGISWHYQFDDRNADQKGPLLDLYFQDDQRGIAVGVFNKFYVTNNGGQNWSAAPEQIDNLDEWHLIAMAQGGEGRVYIASEMGLIFRSVDNGRSFAPLQTDHDGSFHAILARAGKSGSDDLVLMGVGGVLYTSGNGGDSWHLIDTHTEAGLAGATWMDDGRALIVGADGVLLVLSADLLSVSKLQTEAGLPLSAAVPVAGGDALMVGLGGLQGFQLNQHNH